MENRIKVMVFEPLLRPHIEYIIKDEQAYKSIVEGDYTDQYLDKRTVLVQNSKDKELELVPNRHIGNDIICGTFFIVRDAGDGTYDSLSDEQVQYYYKQFSEAEVISQQEVKENAALGFNRIGKVTEYFNNLNIRLAEDNVDIKKVVASYTTDDMLEAKKLLKSLTEEFKETYDVETIDEMVDDGEEFVYIPAVIKGEESGAICIGLIFADLQSSGEPHGAKFLLHDRFYDMSEKEMPDEAQKARERIGRFDHWYPLMYSRDIHSNYDNVPDDIQSMLDYAKGIEEQTESMDINLM